MIITRHGNGAFRVQTGGAAVVIDPEDNRLKADITLQTATPIPLADQPADPSFILGPGEYDLKGVKIYGHAATRAEMDAKMIYSVFELKAEDLTLAFLGNSPEKLNIQLVEKLGEVDILFAPPNAAEFVHQLEPKITVVTHSKDVKSVGKDFGGKIEVVDKLTTKKKDLPATSAVMFING